MVKAGFARVNINPAPGTRDDVQAAGDMVAGEVMDALGQGLTPIETDLRAHSVETEWPLESAPDRGVLEGMLADPEADLTTRLWAGMEDILTGALAEPRERGIA